MKKFILVAVLILVLALAGCLAACGNETGGGSGVSNGGSGDPSTSPSGNPSQGGPSTDERLSDPAFAAFECHVDASGTLFLDSVKDKTITSVTIPEGTDVVQNNSFRDCDRLTTVTFPSTLKEIRPYAFEGCPIESLAFPDSLTRIGQYAFENCSSLRTVSLPSALTMIGDAAFYGCYDLAEVINESRLSLTLGSSANGQVARYAVTVHTGESILTEKDGYYWVTDSDARTWLVGVAAPFGESVTLPLPGDGESYEIKPYFGSKQAALKSLTVPNGVTSVGQGAFAECPNLTSLTLGDSVESVGENVFADSKIRKASIPASAIGMFRGNRRITILEITSGESLPSNALSYCSSLVSLTLPSTLVSLPESSVAYDCKSLVEVIDHSGLVPALEAFDPTNINENALFLSYADDAESVIDLVDDYAFFKDDGKNYLCGYLGAETELTLPSDYKGEGYEVRAYAFRNADCTKLILPEGLTTVGEWAFFTCNQLTEVIAPDLTEIGAFAFHQCYKLFNEERFLIVANQLLEYDGDAESVVVPEGIVKVGTQAFAHRENLRSLAIPSGVKEVGDHVLFSSPNVEELVLNEGLEVIGVHAFSDCKITELVLPDSLREMGSYAFAGCDDLQTVTIGNGLYEIPTCAFSGAYELETVTFGSMVSVIGDAAFNMCKKLRVIEFPASLTSIGEGAFSSCSSLTEVHFAAAGSLMTIGKRAFAYNYALYELDFPSSLQTIGTEAFTDCHRLYSVTLRSGLKSIGGYAFKDCYALAEVINKSDLPIANDDSYGGVGSRAIRIHGGTPQGIYAGESFIRGSDGFVFIEDEGGTWYLVTYRGDRTIATLPTSCDGNGYCIRAGALIGVEEVTISAGVREIRPKAFSEENSYYSELTSATFTDSTGWSYLGSAPSADLSDPSEAADFLTHMNGALTRIPA